MHKRAWRDPDLAEVVAFASICALVLFAPPTPLVQTLALYARANGLSALESGSLLVACVFACLATIALVSFCLIAVARKKCRR